CARLKRATRSSSRRSIRSAAAVRAGAEARARPPSAGAAWHPEPARWAAVRAPRRFRRSAAAPAARRRPIPAPPPSPPERGSRAGRARRWSGEVGRGSSEPLHMGGQTPARQAPHVERFNTMDVASVLPRRRFIAGSLAAVAVLALPGCATTGQISFTEAIRRLLVLSTENAFL